MTHTTYTQRPLEAASKTIRAGASWRGRGRSEVRARDFRFLVDQPAALGGRDEAPTPMELVAGAVGACLGVVAEQVADRRGLAVEGLEVYSLARQDRRGAAGTADVQPYFHRFRLQVAAATPGADPAELEAFADEVERRCPALGLVRDANVELSVAWRFADRLEPGDAEAACNAALGYAPVRDAAPARPVPTLTLERQGAR
ncbi:hypothetical protein USB125703_00749 [Pseudoclavibacter triregionum]|nr:hypothetical protein USB125703_00749 [Pseudoclavibacter triregionum]